MRREERRATRVALFTAIVSVLGLMAPDPAGAGSETYTVTCTAGESEACTTWFAALRAANEHPGHDLIRFAIPGPGPHVIPVHVGSNKVTDRITIDGYSQPGSRMNTAASGSNARILVHFVGRGETTNFNFELRTDASEIHGVGFNGFMHGLDIAGSRNLIRGNVFGAAAFPQAQRNDTGISIEGRENRIGGAEPKDRNIVGGNRIGVRIVGAGDREMQANTITNALIGVGFDGATESGNSFGVEIVSSSGNSIGAAGAGHGNVISANGTGVMVRAAAGAIAHDNRVVNNRIGTDASGTRAVPNRNAGILTSTATAGTMIGGPGTGDGNVISGNTASGVSLWGTGDVVQGNVIGLGVDGTRLPNLDGIETSPSSVNAVVGGDTASPGSAPGNIITGNRRAGIALRGTNTGVRGNLVRGNAVGVHVLAGTGHVVGGDTGAAANRIWTNKEDGVRVTGAATRAQLLGNSFSGTGQGAIDLGDDGATANDAGDADSGPNSVQNFPLIDDAIVTPAGLQVQGVLHSLPERDYRIQVFGQPSLGDGIGTVRCSQMADRGEGRDFLGEFRVRTAGNGTGRFSATVGRADPGARISATATGSDGTSEFSDCVGQIASADLRVVKTAPPGATAGSNFTYTVDIRNGGPSAASGVVMEDELQPTATFVSMTPPRDWSCTHPAPGSGGRIRCERAGRLDPSADWHTFTIIGRVPADTPDGAKLIGTAATVTSRDPDPDMSNNRSSASFTVRRGADLAVVQSAAPSSVAPGGSLSYSLHVTNGGPSDASGAGIEDVLPADTTFASLTHPPGWSCATPPAGSAGGRVTCAIADLPSGAVDQDFTVVVNVASHATGTIVNRATVLARTADPDESDNTSVLRTPVGGQENPSGQAGVNASIAVEAEADPPPQVRSVVVDPASFAFGECSRHDGTQAAGMTFPHGRCLSPAVTVTNTGAASNIHVAGSDAVPADSGPAWVLCYAPACDGAQGLPGDDEYRARLFSPVEQRTQLLSHRLRCDIAFGTAQDDCWAVTGEAQVERVEIVGPRSSSSAARRFSTTLSWVAVP